MIWFSFLCVYVWTQFKLNFTAMARKMLIDGEVKQASHVEEEAHFDFDLFVIGAGSGGVRAARFSANYGAKV